MTQNKNFANYTLKNDRKQAEKQSLATNGSIDNFYKTKRRRLHDIQKTLTHT